MKPRSAALVAPILAGLAGLTAGPATALAHPGHGHTDPDSWTHYLTEPVHIAVLVGTLAVAFVVRAFLRRSQRTGRRPD